MFCTKCGRQIDDCATFCVTCGTRVSKAHQSETGNQMTGQATAPTNVTTIDHSQAGGANTGGQPFGQGHHPHQHPHGGFVQPNDRGGRGWTVLGAALMMFSMWIVALILFLVWRHTRPLRTQALVRGIVIGFVINIIVFILLMTVLRDWFMDFMNYEPVAAFLVLWF